MIEKQSTRIDILHLPCGTSADHAVHFFQSMVLVLKTNAFSGNQSVVLEEELEFRFRTASSSAASIFLFSVFDVSSIE